MNCYKAYLERCIPAHVARVHPDNVYVLIRVTLTMHGITPPTRTAVRNIRLNRNVLTLRYALYIVNTMQVYVITYTICT